MDALLTAEPGLKRLHKLRSKEPVQGPDELGSWAEPFFAPLLGDAIPIVLDTNVLRECVGVAAKKQSQIVLTTIANGLGARVFCAPHVIEEFNEYCDEWAFARKVSSIRYRMAFDEGLKPILRVVRTDGLEQMLLPHESERIRKLQIKDPDDVPTALLALTLGAIPMTMDHECWEAIYGNRADAEQLLAWLPTLLNLGDKIETQKMLHGVAASGVGMTAFSFTLLSRLFCFSPVLGIAAIAGVAFGVDRVLKNEHVDVAQLLSTLFSKINSELVEPNLRASTSLRSREPAFPDITELVASIISDAALSRMCLYVLARSRCAPASRASDIAVRLAQLGLVHDHRRIGYILRRCNAFFEPSRLFWQIGRPID